MTKIDTSTDAVAALLDGVTPGPWEFDNNEGYGADNIWSPRQEDKARVDLVAQAIGDCAESEANARFIAAARDLVPALAAERDALRARVAELEVEREAHHANPADFRYWEGRYRDEKARVAILAELIEAMLEDCETSMSSALQDEARAKLAALKGGAE